MFSPRKESDSPAATAGRRLPAAGLFLFAAAGVLLSPFLPFSSSALLLAAAVLSCAALPLSSPVADKGARAATALVWLALFLFCACLARSRPEPEPVPAGAALYELEGCVRSVSPLAPGRAVLERGALLGGAALRSRAVLLYDDTVLALAPGCRIRAVVAAARYGKTLYLRCASPPVCTGWATPSPVEALRYRLAALAADSLPPAPAALVAAVTVGVRQGFDPAWLRGFRRSGNGHLLAVSGLHAGMVVLFALALAALLGLDRRARWRAAAFLSLAWLALVGFHPPAARAELMVLAVLAAVIAGRPASSLNSLCLAALALVLSSPHVLAEPAFQLSFAAVAGILLFGAPLASLVPRPDILWSKRRRLSAVLARAAALGFGAWAFTTPLLWYHFGLVTPFAFLFSLVTVPLLAFLLAGGALLFVTGMAGFPLAAPAAFAAKSLGLACGAAALLPGAWALSARPPVWVAAAWLVALSGAAVLLSVRPRLAVAAAALPVLLALFFPRPPQGVFALGISPFAEAVSAGGSCVVFASGSPPLDVLEAQVRELGLPPLEMIVPLSPRAGGRAPDTPVPPPLAGVVVRCGVITARCLSPPLAGGLPAPLPVVWRVETPLSPPFIVRGEFPSR